MLYFLPTVNSTDLLANLYNAFNPFEPLPAGDPKYVDCQDVRGDADILQELGNRMQLANTNTCQLYSGHRGAGKSTELLRLKKYLENRQFYVVYFAADEEDIDSEDAQYTDILLACTRRLLKDLKEIASPRPILDWLKDRWVDLKDLALTPIEFEKMAVEVQLAQFAKLTANLGHVRNLLLLTQDAIGRTDELPVSQKAVRRAITQARDTYRRTVENHQWCLLAEVSCSKRIINDDLYRSLMYNRCLLEYRYLDDDGEMQRWYDIHPLIQGIPEFKEAIAKLS